MSFQPTVFIIDDDQAFRESLVGFLDSLDIPVSCHESADSYLASYDESRPGCLIVDVRMPGIDGLQLQRQLAEKEFHPPIVFVTGFGDIPSAVAAMRAGAIDFFEKPFIPKELHQGIQTAFDLDASRRASLGQRNAAVNRIERLSADERLVMDRLVSGMTNKAIAGELNISVRTVQARRARIMVKTGSDSRAALVEITRLSKANNHDLNSG